MQLPVDEEDDEEVVRVPEPLEVGAATLLDREPDHDPERGGHDPASSSGPGDEVRGNEGEDLLARGLCIGVDHGKLGEVDHVGDDVNDGEDDDGPGDSLVERDVLVERDERVERRPAEEGDEVAADGEQDECDIDVEDERSRTRDSYVGATTGVARQLGDKGRDAVLSGTYGR